MVASVLAVAAVWSVCLLNVGVVHAPVAVSPAVTVAVAAAVDMAVLHLSRASCS